MVKIKTFNKLLIGTIIVLLTLIIPSLKTKVNSISNVLPISRIYSKIFDLNDYHNNEIECISYTSYKDGVIYYLKEPNLYSFCSGVVVYKDTNSVFIMDYDGKLYKFLGLDDVVVNLYDYVYPNELIAKCEKSEYYFFYLE